MLDEVYGIRDAVLTPLEHGHTNASFLVETPIARYVLRRAWAGKPAEQVAAEEHVLAHLAAPCDVPRIIPTRGGAPHARVDGRIHHVFALARGRPGPRFLAPGDHGRMAAAMGRLAELHAALAKVPIAGGERWLHARLERLRAQRSALADRVAHRGPSLDAVLARIAALLPAGGTAQWLHGDYHLANLLWAGTDVTAVVDFDDVALGSAPLEAGLALYALARQPAGEEAFVFDPALVATGRAAYGGPIEGDAHLFCASQVLVHLEAALRGSWELTSGIGFGPCWNALSRA